MSLTNQIGVVVCSDIYWREDGTLRLDMVVKQEASADHIPPQSAITGHL